MLSVVQQAASDSGLNGTAYAIIGIVVGGIILAQLTWFGRTVVELTKHVSAMKPQVEQIPQIQEDIRVVSGQVAHIEGQLAVTGRRPR